LEKNDDKFMEMLWPVFHVVQKFLVEFTMTLS